jgi:flagellar biosynthetic protein FlhB
MAEDQDDEDKTEDPSPKKLDEAIKRGDVVKSQELATFFVLSAATVFVAFMTPGL